MSWVIELPYSRPPKGLSANDRYHWAVKAKQTARVRQEVKGLAEAQSIPRLGRVRVEVVWVVNDRRRRDADNAAPFAKAIFDGLAADKGVSAHIVPDDAPEFMTKLMPRIEYRRDEAPHFEVIVTELDTRAPEEATTDVP